MRKQLQAAACIIALIPGASWAQDIAAGEALARSHCSSCHEVGERQKAPLGFAPAFAKIAATKGMTETSIAVFLSTPHQPMPNYVLSRRQIRDVAAYIISLRDPRPTHAAIRKSSPVDPAQGSQGHGK